MIVSSRRGSQSLPRLFLDAEIRFFSLKLVYDRLYSSIVETMAQNAGSS